MDVAPGFGYPKVGRFTRSRVKLDKDSGVLSVWTFPALRNPFLFIAILLVCQAGTYWMFLAYWESRAWIWASVLFSWAAISAFLFLLFLRGEILFRRGSNAFIHSFCFPAFHEKWSITRSFFQTEHQLLPESKVEIHRIAGGSTGTLYPVVIVVMYPNHSVVLLLFDNRAEAEDFALIVSHFLGIPLRKPDA